LVFIKNIPSSDPDEDLVQSYKSSGDLQVLATLYQRYMDLVYGVCLKYLKEPEDAKDATISIFEELITKLHKHEVEHFKNWLYQVSKNHCLMRLRNEKKLPIVKNDMTLMQLEENVHLNSALEKEDRFEQLQACLQQLAEEQRVVIELFYLKGKCYNEIADQTGFEWSKVRSFIQNGRRNLKICMDKKTFESTLK